MEEKENAENYRKRTRVSMLVRRRKQRKMTKRTAEKDNE